MGALRSIGVIESNKLSSAARTKFKDATVETVKSGLRVGDTTLPSGTIDLGDFESLRSRQHEDNFPAWNGFYQTGLLQNIALLLDNVPDAGILKPLGIFDPTKPILMVITKLRALFDRIFSFLTVDIVDLLLENIHILFEFLDDIIESITEIATKLINEGLTAAKNAAERFLDIMVRIISRVLPNRENLDQVTRQIDSNKEEIKTEIVNVAREIAVSSELPLPTFSIPDFDLSFMPPNADISPLFATVETDGKDGIATKFIKMIVFFAKIPGFFIEKIKELGEFFDRIKTILLKILQNVAEGIVELLQFIVGIVWEQIKSLLQIVDDAILEIASLMQIVIHFSKYLAISLIAFLLGSGLVVLSAAKALDIVS